MADLDVYCSRPPEGALEGLSSFLGGVTLTSSNSRLFLNFLLGTKIKSIVNNT